MWFDIEYLWTTPKKLLLQNWSFYVNIFTIMWHGVGETIRTIFQVKHTWKMLLTGSFSIYNFIFCCLWCKLSNAFVLHYQLFLHFVNGRLQPIKRKTPVDQFQSLHKSQLDYWNYNTLQLWGFHNSSHIFLHIICSKHEFAIKITSEKNYLIWYCSLNRITYSLKNK